MFKPTAQDLAYYRAKTAPVWAPREENVALALDRAINSHAPGTQVRETEAHNTIVLVRAKLRRGLSIPQALAELGSSLASRKRQSLASRKRQAMVRRWRQRVAKEVFELLP